MKSLTYKGSGVDIDEASRLVSTIKPYARSTRRAGVMSELGGFGAFFSGRFKGMKSPVLVASTDGVGTKLMVAFKTGFHDTIGVDLVAMSVNDLLVSGAEPLFFLDYLATGRLSAVKHSGVIKGIARGCKEAGCALIGGECAEMPGLYSKGDYDLAGFAVGVVDKKKIVDGSKVRAGDRLIGLGSNGLHSNGYTLARKILFERMGLSVKSRPKGLGSTLGKVLMKPTAIYARPVLRLLKDFNIRGMSHITGGGFIENIPRCMPGSVKAVIKRGSWPVPKIFGLIKSGGRVKETEMLRTFNCGIGFVIIVRRALAGGVLKRLKSLKVRAYDIGTVEARKARQSPVEFIGDKDIFF
jgi:phosphoribosylformylglycinamidine cyclo-ligase